MWGRHPKGGGVGERLLYSQFSGEERCYSGKAAIQHKQCIVKQGFVNWLFGQWSIDVD